jgi:hypothetical protein
MVMMQTGPIPDILSHLRSCPTLQRGEKGDTMMTQMFYVSGERRHADGAALKAAGYSHHKHS